MDIKKIEQMGMEQGFSHVVLLDCDTIELKPEVRQMCAADTCHKYDKCWSCPPGCGSLEECEAKVRQYKYGIIVQTVGELEDVFDGEGMMETEARHKEYFVEFEKKLREIYPDMLAIGAGCCTKCKVCTYPDAPCRFPKQAFSSMEAYGMLVTQVCTGHLGNPSKRHIVNKKNIQIRLSLCLTLLFHFCETSVYQSCKSAFCIIHLTNCIIDFQISAPPSVRDLMAKKFTKFLI